MIKKQKGFAPIIVAVIVMFILGGGYVVFKNNYFESNKINDFGTDVEPKYEWKIYNDEEYAFEFKYPSNYRLDTVMEPESFYEYQVTKIASVSAREKYIDDASFTVTADSRPYNTSVCLTWDYKNQPHTSTLKRDLNGNVFYVFSDKQSDAAMGGVRGEYSQYRILYANRCYILRTSIHWHIVGYGGYIRSGKYDSTPAQNKAQAEAIKQNQELLDAILSTFTFTGSPAEAIGFKTFSSAEYGITFQYPAKYSTNLIPSEYSDRLLPLFQYKDAEKTAPDFIDVGWLPFKPSDNSEQVLMNDVVFDGSGAHPKSFEDFTLVHLGDNDFYKIRTGLFEGVLGYRYFLVRDSGAFVFKLTSNNVPWTEPAFDPERDARHLELREMLKTVRLNI